MRAILHIGTHKTGSSTIQLFLTTNHDALIRQRIFVSKKASNRKVINQFRFCTAVCDQKEWENHHFYKYAGNMPYLGGGFREETYTKEIRKGILEEVAAEIREHEKRQRCDTVIFTCEWLDVASENDISRLREFLAPLFEEVQVLVYLRRQPELLTSWYAQMMKNGQGSGSFDDLLLWPDEAAFWNFHRLLQRWKKVFGKRHIMPRIFDRKAFVNGDLLDDFAFATGVDMAGLIRPECQNESLSSDITEFLRLVNRYHPMPSPWQRNALQRQIRSHIYRTYEKTAKRKGYLLSRARAELILKLFRDSNNRVAREYFWRNELFDEDCSSYPEEIVPHELTLERSVEIAAKLCECWQDAQGRVQRDLDAKKNELQDLHVKYKEIQEQYECLKRATIEGCPKGERAA